MVFEALSEVAQDDWNRTTTASSGEVFTLKQLVEKFDNHLLAHTEQLRGLAATI
jgi:hypothetical protein